MIKAQESKSILRIAVYAVVGIVLIFIGIAANVGMMQLRRSHSETDAEVVAIRRSYRGTRRAVFRFTVNDVVFHRSSYYLIGDLYVGKQVSIYYNPNNPGGIIMRTGWSSSGGFPILHGFMMIASGVFFASNAVYLLINRQASRRLSSNEYGYLQFSKSLKHETEKMRNACMHNNERHNDKAE